MSRVSRRVLLQLCIVAASAGSTAVHAQTPPVATIRVRVTDPTGNPIAGADIAILNDRQESAVLVGTSDAAGRHTFSLVVDSARYRITARKLGFVSTTRRLLARASDTLDVTLRLASADVVAELPTVVSRERYQITADPGAWDGFAERCSGPISECVTGDSLATRPNNMDAFFNRLGGVIPIESNAGTWAIPKMYSTLGGQCQPNVFMNGFEWDSAQVGNLATAYGPTQFKGVEVYPTGQPRPMRFRGSNWTCGAIVLWLN